MIVSHGRSLSDHTPRGLNVVAGLFSAKLLFVPKDFQHTQDPPYPFFGRLTENTPYLENPCCMSDGVDRPVGGVTGQGGPRPPKKKMQYPATEKPTISTPASITANNERTCSLFVDARVYTKHIGANVVLCMVPHT